MEITLYDLAQRFIGLREVGGDDDNPFIVWSLGLCGFDPHTTHDEVPWCSAWLNSLCWLLRLPRSKSAAARSWLTVGRPVKLEDAKPAYDIVVFSRGSSPKTGHVGVFAGLDGDSVYVLGGNQGNMVSVMPFPRERVLGVRRLS